MERVEAEFPPEAIKFLSGAVGTGVGGLMLAEAAALAAAFGIAVVTVKLVAIVLLFWGLSRALPALMQIAMDRLRLSGQGVEYL